MMRKTFAGFNVADFRSRWIQFFFPTCRLLASSGAKNVVLVFIQVSVHRCPQPVRSTFAFVKFQ